MAPPMAAISSSAWNVVTSYLPDANANFGIGDELMAHDERYERAEEYMEVVYKLWEHSWEEDAAVRDAERDVHNDPDKVHEINHVGRWFDVPGPHMCEPSPQRTPVLFQAGQSSRGVAFAARHAEAVFGIWPNTESCAEGVQKVRAAAKAENRPADSIRVFPGVTVIVAPTDEEAKLKVETCRQYASPEGALALFSGWAGIDLATIDGGKSLDSIETDAIQGVLGVFNAVNPEIDWTLDQIGEYMSIGSVNPKIVGSPTTVADELERWMDETGCDGFNLVPVNQSIGFFDFVDLVVPELQRRGRMRTEYEGKTLRESYFGEGHSRLAPSHIGHRSVPEWKRSAGPAD